MSKNNFDILLKKSLLLETSEREKYLSTIDIEVKNKINDLLLDTNRLTQYLLKTLPGIKTNKTTSIQDIEPKDQINQFIILKLIAKGGMGLVYLAYDVKLKRNVAIKAIRNEYSEDLLNQQRFKREAQLLSQIKHPSICQIHDYIDYKNGNLLVLEYIDGFTLNEKDFDKSELLEIFIQIASALKAAHSKGIIHRDLKPDNIMVTVDNEVKILDFGIAKSNTTELDSIIEEQSKYGENQSIDLTHASSLMGTLLYMSPEQQKNYSLTPFSDIYTFGIIMQQQITGCGAYNYDGVDELKQQIEQANIVNLESVDKEYQRLIKQMLNVNAQERPSATKVHDKLKKIKEQKQFKKENHKKGILIGLVTVLAVFLIWQYSNFQHKVQKNLFLSKLDNSIYEVKISIQNSYALPIHNVSKDFVQVNKQIEVWIKQIQSNTLLSASEKSYYIGRYYTAVEKHEKAIVHYNKALDFGLKKQNLFLQLANAYSYIYFKKTIQYSNTYGVAKPEKLTALHKHYLPLIKKHKHLIKEENKNSLANALILWHQREGNAAISMLDEIISGKDWLFEAYSLKAYIITAQAEINRVSGNYERSVELNKKALKTYEEAKQRGRSYDKAYLGLCKTNFSIINDGVNRTAKDITSAFLHGSNACKNALTINPNSTGVYRDLARYNYYYAYSRHQKGESFRKFLYDALIWNSKSLGQQLNFRAYNTKAEIYALLAQDKLTSGESPMNEVNQSIIANQKALAMSDKNNAYLYSSMIYTLLVKLKYQILNGVNTSQSIAQAQNFYNEGFSEVLTNDTKKYFYLNIAEAYRLHAKFQVHAGHNPNKSVQTIEKYIEDEQNIVGDEANGLNVLAGAFALQVKYNRQHGTKSNQKLIQKALHLVEKANTLLNNIYPIKNTYAQIIFEETIDQKQSNEVIKKNLKQVINLLNKSLKINPKVTETYVLFAAVYLHLNLVTSNKNQKLEFIEKGVDSCLKALEINPNNPFAIKYHALLINHAVAQGFYSKEDLVKSKNLIAKAHAINPLLSK